VLAAAVCLLSVVQRGFDKTGIEGHAPPDASEHVDGV